MKESTQFEWTEEIKALLEKALLEAFLKDTDTVEQLKQSVWDNIRK